MSTKPSGFPIWERLHIQCRGCVCGGKWALLPKIKEKPMSNETNEIIEALRTPAGGFTRKGLESIGVPWPPPKGWRKNLIRDNALADRSNVVYFPRNEVEEKPEEDTYRLVKFHLRSSEYEALKELAIKNRKPMPGLIMELVTTYGDQIQPYRHPTEFEYD